MFGSFSNKNTKKLLSSHEEVDRGVVAGICLSFILILIGIFAGGRGENFFNFGGILIVLGGTFGATLVHFSVCDIKQAWKAFLSILHVRRYHPLDRIQYLVSLARHIRKNGLLILDKEAGRCRDSFLKLAFEITVDGQNAAEIRRILETEIRTSNDRAWRAVQVFETMGNYAPAMGLIGTLIGLIQMLGGLNDLATVGPAMSVALSTTLYGAILANLVFLPIAGKLKNASEEEALVKAISVEGMISLGKEENPIVLEQRLQGFLPLVGNA